MPPELPDKLLMDNITKTYKNTSPLLEAGINHKTKQIASTYNVDNRTKTLARSPAFISLKDHKENFNQKNRLMCRLINLCRNELVAISKKVHVAILLRWSTKR